MEVIQQLRGQFLCSEFRTKQTFFDPLLPKLHSPALLWINLAEILTAQNINNKALSDKTDATGFTSAV